MSDPVCPFLKKPCIEHQCMMYTHIVMNNPQTAVQEDKWSCAVAWLPILLIENARAGRNVASAVDCMRNEVTERQDVFNHLAIEAKEKRVLGSRDENSRGQDQGSEDR